MLGKKIMTYSAISMALASTSVMADSMYKSLTIKQLPQSGYVTLEGSIDDIENNQEFSLRDKNGDTIDVELSNKASLNEGDRVSVSGTLDDEFLGLGIELNNATLEMLDKADEKVSSQSGATSSELTKAGNFVTVEALPEQGAVSIQGEVADVDEDSSSFTLKDSLGETIDVHAQAMAQIDEGDSVIVYGEVKSSLAGLNEEIEAQNIVVAVNK